MQNSKQFDEAEGVFKRYGRRRTRKSYWRQKWITLTNGAWIDQHAIKQTMSAPKLLSAAMPRVILKEEYLQRPRSPESEFGLQFVHPRAFIERRIAQRRGQSCYSTENECGFEERRVLDNRRLRRGFGKKAAEQRNRQDSQKQRRVKNFEVTVDYLATHKGRTRTSLIVPVPGVFKKPIFQT